MIIKKEQAINAIKAMPKDEYDIDEILEEIIVLKKIQKGLLDIKKGRVLSEKEIEKQIRKW